LSDWEVTTIYDCPVCGREDCVPANGVSSSPILIVAEMPGSEEIKYGEPLIGATGRVLRTELAYLGIDMKSLRLCNLWLHEPNKNEKCLEYGASKVIEEAKGRKAILLVGSDVVEYFCNIKVTKVSGLEVTSPYLSAPLIMACPNPALVFKGSGIGEMRLALQKFVKKAEKYL
jgi:uracil-DNA glycosylase family 4